MPDLPPSPFARVERIPLYVPGKPIQEVQRELGSIPIVKLASNENPWGPTEAVKTRLRKVLEGSEFEGIGLYPVSDGFYLRQAIAQRRQVGLDQVILGNGSSELLELIAKVLFPGVGGSAVIPKFSFAIYGIATQAAGGVPIEASASATELDVDAILRAVRPDTRLVYLGHPNNPTGAMLARAELERLVRGLREDIVLVVDQAYAEYENPATYPDAAAFLGERELMLVLHTFSKIHALAALRIGYGLGSKALIQAMERVRSPFNTNHLAQAAAEVAVADVAFEGFSRQMNAEARVEFINQAKSHRCVVSGKAGNFLLLESAHPAGDLFKALLAKGVIIRPMQGYGLPNQIRISMGKPAEMATFWAAVGPLLDCGC